MEDVDGETTVLAQAEALHMTPERVDELRSVRQRDLDALLDTYPIRYLWVADSRGHFRMSTPESTPSVGSASALQQTLADIVQVIDVPVSMGAGKVMLKVRERQGAVHLGAAHLVNARGEVRAVEVLSFPPIEVTSAEVIESGTYVIRVRGATADDASGYQWLVQE